MFGRRRPNVWPHQNVQVAVQVEVDVDLDEEHGVPFKQTVTVQSQAELDLITAELQMKKDFQI